MVSASVGSPIVSKSLSCSRLHTTAGSPSQTMARKLVRKYSLASSRHVTQRKELTALRTSLPNVRAASDFEVVMAAIKYIESLQSQVLDLSDKITNNSTPSDGPTRRRRRYSQMPVTPKKENNDKEKDKEKDKMEKNNN